MRHANLPKEETPAHSISLPKTMFAQDSALASYFFLLSLSLCYFPLSGMRIVLTINVNNQYLSCGCSRCIQSSYPSHPHEGGNVARITYKWTR